MTPLQFEAQYRDEWEELQSALDTLRSGKRRADAEVEGERIASLYRRACEQLALARARAYPAYLVGRLNQLTADAHQLIYQHRDYGLGPLKRLVAFEFPRAVRAHKRYVQLSAAVFLLPMLVLGVLVYARPELILSVVDPMTAASFQEMYSESGEALGRLRGAGTDWAMFGFYIRNNIGIGFQCFASGLFAGLGSLFFLAFNGAFIGAVAGFLTAQGLSTSFYSFVVTHTPFELTAIVLCGASGLRIGHAIVSPGRHRRRDALVIAGRESIVLVYGATGMLLVAAAIEAFWSSGRWLPLPLKYSVAACCWVAVFGYLWRQGRHAG
ncbi:MAG TPA: stage II sporulation protein M [Woeseiaceae bacterium]|nr:stage II sporulation protein M [Woeseiaceae bacterium]